MKNKEKEINLGLLIFAITTIMWCVIFSYIIGKIDGNHRLEVENLKSEYSINE